MVKEVTLPPEYVLQWLPLELMGVVAAVAAGAWLWRAILGPALKRARAVGRQVEDFLESWQGRPGRPGYPPEPGVPERLRSIEDLVPGWTTALGKIEDHTEAIEEIRYHVRPNHGGSAHDALSAKLDALTERVGHVMESQIAVAGAVDRLREDKERAHDEMLRRIARIELPRSEES